MLKSFLAVVSTLLICVSAVRAESVRMIDDFESGTLDLSAWSIDSGDAAHADTYNAISARYDNGEGPKLYYPPEGSWMLVISAGDPVTKLSTAFTSFSGGKLDMQVFFSAIETYVPVRGPDWSHNDLSRIEIDGVEIFYADVATTGTLHQGMDNTGWVNLSVPLSAGSHLLELSVVNDGGDYFLDSQLAVDNIRVTYATAPVPEPSAWAMMAVGLGLISLTIRRRNWSVQTG